MDMYIPGTNYIENKGINTGPCSNGVETFSYACVKSDTRAAKFELLRVRPKMYFAPRNQAFSSLLPLQVYGRQNIMIVPGYGES